MPRFRPGHGNIHHSSPLDMESTPEMSILNKLKNASGQMSNRLLEKHPLAGESLELRLQYLAAIALATAIDREATLAERQAFNGLAASLSIEAGDAEEQFNERANVEEDSIAVLFEALRARQAGQLYMLDLAWIHAVDGEVDENEQVVTEHLAHLLGMPVQAVRELHEFSVALHRKELSRVYRLFPAILGDEVLKELLTPLIQKQMPFAGILNGRWIDSGGEEVTDCLTGLIWRRAVIGTQYREGSFSGSPKELLLGCLENKLDSEQKKEIKRSLEEFQAEKINHVRQWRLPKEAEIQSTLENKEIDKSIFNIFEAAAVRGEGSSIDFFYVTSSRNFLSTKIEVLVCADQ